MSQQKHPGDAALVRRSRAGDRKAFTELVRRYQRAAYAAAIGRLGNVHDAMDVVQDAFVAAYCKLGQLREGKRFGPWLRTIVRRRAWEWIRSRRRGAASAFALTDGHAGLDRASRRDHDRRRRRAELREAVDALPQKYREVVLLHYLQRWPYRRIAEFTGLPVSTVKGRLHRARNTLKRRLSTLEEGAEIMKRSEIEKNVKQAIYRIATQEIHETIPMGDTENVVLFCGVFSDVEICHTQGDEVILNGTKASLGPTEAEAKASAAGIQVLSDRVEDWFEAGPHDGELFVGTDTDKDGNPVGMGVGTKEIVSQRACPLHTGVWEIPGADTLYKHLVRTHPEVNQSVRAMMRKATRITIVREKMEDVVLSRKAWTEEIQRVFVANYGNDDISHGPVGRVSLTVGVPVGRGVTVISGCPNNQVRIADLRSNANVTGSWDVVLSDIAGDVCLLDGFAREARNIRGRFVQSFYGIGPGDSHHSGKNLYVRGQMTGITMSSKLRNIEGQAWIDVAKLDVEAADLHGDVDIRNCFGTTRLHKTRHQPGTRNLLETDSGKVLVFLKEELLGEVSVAAISLSGQIEYEGLKDLGSVFAGNNLYTMRVSTRGSNVLEADILIKTRDGDVAIEKTA